MKSSLKNALSTPRKINLVLRAVRNIKNVKKLLTTLSFIQKKAAFILGKVIKSAKDNVEFYNKKPDTTKKIKVENLEIEHIRVGPGETRKRWFPRARGNSDRILKRTTNIDVQLRDMGSALEGEDNGN